MEQQTILFVLLRQVVKINGITLRFQRLMYIGSAAAAARLAPLHFQDLIKAQTVSGACAKTQVALTSQPAKTGEPVQALWAAGLTLRFWEQPLRNGTRGYRFISTRHTLGQMIMTSRCFLRSRGNLLTRPLRPTKPGCIFIRTFGVQGRVVSTIFRLSVIAQPFANFRIKMSIALRYLPGKMLMG
jgi:hypothetical protein